MKSPTLDSDVVPMVPTSVSTPVPCISHPRPCVQGQSTCSFYCNGRNRTAPPVDWSICLSRPLVVARCLDARKLLVGMEGRRRRQRPLERGSADTPRIGARNLLAREG